MTEPSPLLPNDRRPIWVLALFLVSCLLGQLHHASERHVVCDEHGEVTHEVAHAHGALVAHGPLEAHVDEGTGSEGTGAEVAADPVEGEGHHHCPIASFHHEDFASFDVDGLRPEFAADAVGGVEPGRVVAGAADRYRLAPKQSPPA